MSNQRFYLTDDLKLCDKSDNTFYPIDDSRSMGKLCDKLNQLYQKDIESEYKNKRYIPNYQGETIESITDSYSGKRLNISDMCKELNWYEENRLKKNKRIHELTKIQRYCFDVIDGFIGYAKLREMGLVEDEWEER